MVTTETEPTMGDLLRECAKQAVANATRATAEHLVDDAQKWLSAAHTARDLYERLSR